MIVLSMSQRPGLSATNAVRTVRPGGDDDAVAPIGFPSIIERMQHAHHMALHMDRVRHGASIGEGECDDLAFIHFEQSLRVVDILEKGGKGLNLTHEVRAGNAILSTDRPKGKGFAGLDGQ